MHESRKFFQVGLDYCFVINVFHIVWYGPPLRSNWTPGVNCFSSGAVPLFLRKHSIRETCEEDEKAGCFAIVV